jgi:hypothetical protein
LPSGLRGTRIRAPRASHEERVATPDPRSPKRGVISITDWDWFQFLREQPDLDEANLWRPRMPAGTPFIFKLKKKHGGWIVRFGIFATHVIQPMWLAWDEFEKKNEAVRSTGHCNATSRVRLVDRRNDASPYTTTEREGAS